MKEYFLIGCLLIALISKPAWGGSPPQFTPEEEQWLRGHPVVKVQSETNWPPFEYRDHGQRVGFVPSYLDAISAISGLRFHPVSNINWGDGLDALQAGKVDLVSNVSTLSASERANNQIIVSRPYFVASIVVVTDNRASIVSSLSELGKQRVALRGRGGLEYFVRTTAPNIEVLPFDTEEEALEAVMAGDADAALGVDTTVLPLLRRKFYGRLYQTGVLIKRTAPLSMATRRDSAMLASIIDKSIAAIPPQQAAELAEKWLSQADYGRPSFESIVRYRAPQLAIAAATLLLFALLTFISLRLWRRASRGEREKAQFLAFMSHEIRSPVHAILASLEMLRKAPNRKNRVELFDVALTASESLLKLLDDVLEYSRLDARRTQLEMLPTEIVEWARQTIDLVRWRAEQKKLDLSLVIECDPRLTVLVDPTRLRQIVVNLLTNAIKFTSQGAVSLTVKYQQSSITRQAGELVLLVSDSGIGIPVDRLDRIFEAYAQAETETVRHYGGTGLGLAICRQLSELMGGDISVRSSPGELTTFTVRIPARPSQVESGLRDVRPDTDVPTAPAPHLRILVVDDRVENLKLIRAQLLSLGHEADIADGGGAALYCFDETRHDMVITDLNMPGMDGVTLARCLRAQGTAIPIVMLTGDAADETYALCQEVGVDRVLIKPASLDVLAQTLQQLVPGQREATASITPVMDIARGPLPADVYQALSTSTTESVVSIRQALEDGHKEIVLDQLHSLRGSFSMIHENELADVCRQMEEKARADRFDEIGAALRMFEQLAHAAIARRSMRSADES
ncbi:ATP-binding protein [Burkholderia diffusa]|nr:ATP-binding protein [Burkholderia diffusa]